MIVLHLIQLGDLIQCNKRWSQLAPVLMNGRSPVTFGFKVLQCKYRELSSLSPTDLCPDSPNDNLIMI